MTDASFSECGNYRWWLKRRISKEDNILFFIGLNPSKANEYSDDPTLRRMLRFCKCWGYGTLLVMNLFARISSSPKILHHCLDPIGNDNDQHLLNRITYWSENSKCDLWLGWGAGGSWKDRNLEVIYWLKKAWSNRSNDFPSANGPMSVGVTRLGHPRHPLYTPAKEVLKPFSLSKSIAPLTYKNDTKSS